MPLSLAGTSTNVTRSDAAALDGVCAFDCLARDAAAPEQRRERDRTKLMVRRNACRAFRLQGFGVLPVVPGRSLAPGRAPCDSGVGCFFCCSSLSRWIVARSRSASALRLSL